MHCFNSECDIHVIIWLKTSFSKYESVSFAAIVCLRKRRGSKPEQKQVVFDVLRAI